MEISQVVTVDAPIARVWDHVALAAALVEQGAHLLRRIPPTSMDGQATGCFCERFPDRQGSVEHARILYIQPPQMIRLSGALGPLQAEAVVGTLTFKLAPEGRMPPGSP